ncbi:MAG TPA: hypothetical protein VJ697_16535, partial [Nitrososphaeraceae archaeon]|nr:hypothetical protein [Nitrososphaeraceae archaeon]
MPFNVTDRLFFIKIRKYMPIIMCFLTWFSSAFIFVQIPTLAREIKVEIFPSTDVITSILMVSLTLSISLIARFLGGLFLGSSANTNGIRITILSIVSLAILTLIQIFVISIFKLIDIYLAISLFMIIRFFIGFFIGGIWPNLGIFTLEEFYRKEDNPLPNPNSNKEDDFRRGVQRYGMKSAFIQTGLTVSFLIESMVIILISIYSVNVIEWGNQLGILLPNSNLLQIQLTSIIGLILLSIVSIYWFCYMNKTNQTEYNKYYSKFLSLSSRYNSLRDLLNHREYRHVLLNLWLIVTGLMYMYYSTVIVTPELLFRFNLPNLFQEETITFVVALYSFVGHILLGILYLINKNQEENNQDFTLIKKIAKIILSSVLIMIFVYVLLYPISESANKDIITQIIIIFQINLAFLANLPWALVPAILTSRFPKHFRLLAGSLAYNGGLVFSFASPFLLQQVIIYSQNNYQSYIFVLVPMVLGGLSVWLGSRRLLPKHVKGKKDYGYFEIEIPYRWEKHRHKSFYSSVLDKVEINEYSFSYLKKWMMSVYYLKVKNESEPEDSEISLLRKELVRLKINDEDLFGELYNIKCESAGNDYPILKYTKKKLPEKILAKKKLFLLQ